VQLKILNMLGQVVRTLVDEEQGTGYHQAVWHGTDEAGRPVSTGIYPYRIKAGDFVETKKMQLVK
jgi:flagellar hook assembly protein FlgD